jgi:hypothetical protein
MIAAAVAMTLVLRYAGRVVPEPSFDSEAPGPTPAVDAA